MPRKMAREPGGTAPETPFTTESSASEKAPPKASKIETVRTLLRRDEGATLAELVAATGWLPHTTRASLTGLKKKGSTLAKSKRNGVTCYHIVDPS